MNKREDFRDERPSPGGEKKKSIGSPAEEQWEERTGGLAGGFCSGPPEGEGCPGRSELPAGSAEAQQGLRSNPAPTPASLARPAYFTPALPPSPSPAAPAGEWTSPWACAWGLGTRRPPTHGRRAPPGTAPQLPRPGRPGRPPPVFAPALAVLLPPAPARLIPPMQLPAPPVPASPDPPVPAPAPPAPPVLPGLVPTAPASWALVRT